MGWGKYVGLFILGCIPPFLFIGGPVLFPLLGAFWGYVKFCIKVDIIVIYLIVRLPIWLFIQLPLYSLKYSTQKIDEVFSRGFNALNRRRKLSVFFITVFGLFFAFLFPFNTSFQPLNPFFWWSNIINALRVAVGALGTTIIFLTIIETFSGGVAQKEMPGKWAKSELFAEQDAAVAAVAQSADSAQRAVEGAMKANETKNKAQGVYSDIKTADTKGSIKALPKDMGKALTNLGESFGLEVEAGAAEAEAGAAAAASNPLGWMAVGVFLFALFIFVVQLVFVTAYFIGFLQFVAPIVLGPVAAALGLGSDYGNYLGGEVADRYLAGLRVNFDTYVDPVLEARQRVYCLLQGPACMRQWRLNNTRTPGSNAVGEQYLLSINRFEVGSGDRLDIAYKDGDYKVPTSFGLKNSRNGLKGINALNVSYRIRVIDFDRGRDDPFCDTEWTPVSGFDIREDAEGRFKGNDLYPGTAANTNFLTLDEFNLKNCGLLQPGAGETRTVILDVKYDYFSQATLYFDAMAQETLLSDPSIEKNWKKSETADTPVKSALNVNSPVLFDQSEGDSQPFSMRTTLFTEERNIEYKINELQVRKSSQVRKAEGANRNCQLESASGRGENVMVPSDNAPGIGDNEKDGETRWYDSTNSPPFFGCIMELKDIGSISPEGETLTMGVASNYTLKLEEPLDRFRVLNTRCTEFNCPLLVTRNFADSQESKDNWKHKCEGPDAGRTGGTAGCSVVQGDPNDWSTIGEDLMTGNKSLESRIERGEIAIDPFQVDELGGPSYNLTNIPALTGNAGNDGRTGKVAVGLTQDKLDQIENDYYSRFGDIEGRGFALVSYLNTEGDRDVEVKELEYILCRQEGDRKKYARYLAQTRYFGQEPAWVSFSPAFTNCGSDKLWESFGKGFKSEQKIRPSILLGPYALIVENTVRGLKEEYDNMAEQYRALSCEGGDGSSFKVYDPDEGLKCVGGEESYPEQESSGDGS
ncbi:MAG: hypothetical protein BRC29_01040 [Nanohaloarchaea archaeon SW_7_43_1]|nr:MAG: hypothetical protein BRC29_01040 [Nanohaloarchaea archaeon SW_7_43_1]